jgi:hypothetical protein
MNETRGKLLNSGTHDAPSDRVRAIFYRIVNTQHINACFTLCIATAENGYGSKI